MQKPVRIYSSSKGNVEDFVAASKRLRILLNGRHLAGINLSPALEEEAAIGYLASQGIVGYKKIKGIRIGQDFVDVRADGANGFEAAEAGDCGGWTEAIVKGSVSVKGVWIEPAVAKKSMDTLQKNSIVWQETGGTHSCGLYSLSGELLFMVEDISRHVALDKAIGLGLKRGLEFANSFVATSGRVSASCVLKCARMGIPAIVSRSAPLLEAVEAANASGLTLIGFARGDRFNAYSNCGFYGKV